MLEAAYNSSINSAGATAEAMETAMSSIESKIALFQQATTTMWQNTISSDFIKGLVDVGTAIVELTDKVGLGTVAFESFIAIMMVLNKSNWTAWSSDIMNAVNVLGNAGRYRESEQALSTYVKVLGQLDTAQQKAVLSKLGYSKATRDAIMADVAAANAEKVVTAEKLKGALADKLGNEEKAKLVIKELEAAGAIQLENGALKAVNKEKLISILETKDMTAEEAKEFVTALGLTGANTGLAASFKLLTVSIGTAAKELALFLLTNPIGWIVDALILIPLLIKGIDKVTVTYDEQIDKLKELQEEYKNIKSELESVNGEIESATERIKELTSIDTSKLSIVEQKELDDLREEVRLLQIRKSILESQEKESKSKANKAAQKAAKKTVKSEFVDNMNYAMMGITNYGQVNRVTPQEELELSLKTYRKYSEEIAKIDEQLANGSIKQSKYDSLKKTYEDKQLKALSRANKMSESIATMREGLDEADASNANLIQSTDKVLDEYGLFSDEINKTTTYFNSLEEAKRKQVIIDKMVADGVKGDINGFVKDLNDEDLCILYTMNMDEETSIEDLKQGIANMQKEADGQPITVTTVAGKASDVKNYISTQKATVAGSNSEQTLDTIFNNYESEINKLSDYLAKAVNNGLSNSDYVALSTDFGIVASSAKEAEEAIREVMDASESSTIKVLDEAIKNASETGREDLVSALEGIKDRLAEVNDEAQKLSDGNSGFAKAMSSMAEGFDALDKIYVDVKNGKDKNKSSENNGAYFDFSSLVDSNFVDQFQECGDAYQNFLDVVMRTPDDINACQSAFDDLATKYVLQRAGIEDLVDAQGNINEAMKQTTITQLKNWGILNAKELVDNECAAAALYHKSAIDELNVSSDASVGVLANEASALLNESNASGVTKTALFDLISAQKIFNNTNLDTSGKIKALRDLAVAFGLTAEQAQNAANKVDMNKAIAEAQKKSIAANHRLLNNSEMDAIRNQYLSSAKSSISGSIAAEFGKLTGRYGGGQTSNKVGSSGGSGSSNTTTVTKDYINWAENSIDNLTNKIERLQSLITDTTSYSKKIKYLKEIYSYQKKLVNIESKNVTATKKQYNKMLNNLSGSQKKKYKKLIESTTAVSYEQFVSTTTTGGKKKSGNKTVNKETKTLYEAVSNAQSAWKEYQDALGSYKEKNTQLIQHQIDIYEAELDYMDQKISVYEERIERAQSRIDDIDSEKVLKDVKKGNKLFSKKKPSSKTVKKYAEEYGMSADRYKKLFKNKNNTDEYKAGVLQGAYNAKQYKIEASNYKNIINLQNSKADKLIKERKLVGTTTEKYKELSEEIAKAQAEAMKASEELEEQLYNIANAEFSAIQNAYKTTSERTSGRADAIQSRIDYKINNGGEVSKTDYEKVISLRKDDENKALQERLDLERKLTETRNKLKKLNKSDKNYKQNLAALTRAEKDQTLAVYESISAYYQKKEATRAAQLQMIKAPLVNLERELKLIQAQIAELEKLKQKYTDSIGVVNYYLGEQIENLNKQKDNINAYYDSIIDPLQKQLDLLSKVNEQRDRALALEKAQYELEKAKSQKTQKVLRNGSWQWEADQESVRDAQKNLDDAKYNKITGEIKDTIDELTRARDEQIKAYDKEIERISTIQSEWSKAVERAEYMSKIDVFESTFGKGSLQKILNGDGSILDQVVNRLQDVQLNLDSLDIDQERIEGQIQSVNDLVTAFETGKQTFEEAEKYIDGASDSLKELESDAAQNVPTVIETMGELSTSIVDITKKCKSLSSKYKKTMQNISSSTEGTSGTAKQLSKLSTSLNKVKKQIDKINPVTGATAEQLSSIKNSIVETGKVLTDLSDGYLEDANDLFIRLADEGVQKSYEKFAKIGKYITDNLIPRVSSLCSSIQTLSNKYSTSADRIGDAQSETNDFNIACKNVINSLKTLRSQNIQAAQSYNQLATAANKAATAARAAAAAAKKQAAAAAKASSASSSSSSSSVISKVVSSVGNLFGKVLSGSSHSEGTKNAKAGTSLVGETAPELVWHKKKKTYQLASEPSLVKLDAGDVVFNGEETKSIMKNGAISTIKDIKGLQSKMFRSSYGSNINNAPSSNSNMNETIIHIDRVELPNIKNGDDAQRLVDALCNLDGTITQKLHSN